MHLDDLPLPAPEGEGGGFRKGRTGPGRFGAGGVFKAHAEFEPLSPAEEKPAGGKGVRQFVREDESRAPGPFQRGVHRGVNAGEIAGAEPLHAAQNPGAVNHEITRAQALQKAELAPDGRSETAVASSDFKQGQPSAEARARLFPAREERAGQQGRKRGRRRKIPARADRRGGRAVITLAVFVESQFHEAFHGNPASGGENMAGKIHLT